MKYHIKIESSGTAREIVEGLRRLANTLTDSTRNFRQELGTIEIDDEVLLATVSEVLEEAAPPPVEDTYYARTKQGNLLRFKWGEDDLFYTMGGDGDWHQSNPDIVTIVNMKILKG